MNKTQLIEAIAEDAKLTRGDAKRAVDSFIKIAGDVMSTGDKLAIMGFGTFSVTRNPPRTGRNFKTGAPVKIAAKNVVKFKPGVELYSKVD